MTLEQALDHLRHGVPIAPSPEFPDAVNTRLASAAQTAARQCTKVPAAATQRVLNLLDVAAHTDPTGGLAPARSGRALATALSPSSGLPCRLQPLLPHSGEDQRSGGGRWTRPSAALRYHWPSTNQPPSRATARPTLFWLADAAASTHNARPSAAAISTWMKTPCSASCALRRRCACALRGHLGAAGGAGADRRRAHGRRTFIGITHLPMRADRQRSGNGR